MVEDEQSSDSGGRRRFFRKLVSLAAAGGLAALLLGEQSGKVAAGTNTITPGVVDGFIGGGDLNKVTDNYGFVGGGYSNRAGDDFAPTTSVPGATVGGGGYNTAPGERATVGGGDYNTASGVRATVGGGYSNTANGSDATVPGGAQNLASGQYSFAAGRRARTETSLGTVHDGAFVWADSNDYNFYSAAGNEFAVRCTGGARFVTGIDGSGNPTRTMRIRPDGGVTVGQGAPEPSFLADDGNVLTVYGTDYAYVKCRAVNTNVEFAFGSSSYGDQAFLGAMTNHHLSLRTKNEHRLFIRNDGNVGIGTTTPGFLLEVNGTAGKPGGGSWTASSDIRLKKNIRPLHDALDRMLQLHGVTYEWKEPERNGDMNGAYMGMIAQEVEQVFPEWVGVKPDGYKTLTFIGFEALAVEAFRELKEEISHLRRQNESLRARLEALEGRAEVVMAR